MASDEIISPVDLKKLLWEVVKKIFKYLSCFQDAMGSSADVTLSLMPSAFDFTCARHQKV